MISRLTWRARETLHLPTSETEDSGSRFRTALHRFGAIKVKYLYRVWRMVDLEDTMGGDLELICRTHVLGLRNE